MSDIHAPMWTSLVPAGCPFTVRLSDIETLSIKHDIALGVWQFTSSPSGGLLGEETLQNCVTRLQRDLSTCPGPHKEVSFESACNPCMAHTVQIPVQAQRQDSHWNDHSVCITQGTMKFASPCCLSSLKAPSLAAMSGLVVRMSNKVSSVFNKSDQFSLDELKLTLCHFSDGCFPARVAVSAPEPDRWEL